MLDCNLYAQDQDRECEYCGVKIGGVVIEVRDSIIWKVFVVEEKYIEDLLGEHKLKADIVVIKSNGFLEIRSDWFDPKIKYVEKNDVEYEETEK